ncbi:hypothetical protein [Runella rosea]|nr:hypothetical protein [Runella rosea]
MELIHVSLTPLSLSQLAEALGLSKKGIDKASNRLVEQGHLVKSGGKLSVSKSTIVELSTTKSENVELSTTPNNESVELSTTIEKILEQSSTENGEQSENRRTKYYDVEQSATITDDEPHAYTHGGSSNNINIYFETLKEEKIKEKINPLPPDKKENQKEEMVLRAKRRAELHRLLVRRGKRLKCLPKRKKPINIPFDDWWNAYQKKVDRSVKLEKKWERLTDEERAKAMQHTAAYVLATPDKKYRKNPETYLNNKSFNNEIIQENGKSNIIRPSGYGVAPISQPTRPSPPTVKPGQMGPIEL